jgi:hypothetical protein
MGLEVTNWISSVFVLLLGDCFIVHMFVGCRTKSIMIHKEHDLKGSLISITISPLSYSYHYVVWMFARDEENIY